MKDLLNKLNNYDWSNEQIEIIKNYITTKRLPQFRTNALRDRFIEKYKDFIVENNKLVYEPLHLEVIPNDKRDETLKQFYDDYKAIGTGKVGFYKKITSNYLNINRAYCSEFLSKQPYYQINTETKYVVNKPILASSCGERLAIDLVSVENISDENDNYNHILTAIDYFSRKVWARPLLNKKAAPVLEALKSIFDEMTIKPHIVQSDNGREFKNYKTIQWYKDNDIQYIFTLPYAPQSNGLIENFNKQLRKMMREIFIRNNNLRWVEYLQICCDNKNTQYNKTTKHSPNTLWNEDSFYTNVKNKTRELPPSIIKNEATPEAIRINARNNIKEKAKKQIEQTKITELEKGDHVRVKMSSLYSELRKQVKAGKKKLINVSYSPEIYKIFKVLKEDHPGYERKRYTLRHLDNSPLYTESKMNEMTHAHTYRRLFASELIKVDKDTENVSFNNHDANVLNQIETIVKENPKPTVVKPKKNKNPIPDSTQDEPILVEPRRSARGQILNRQNKDIGYDDKNKR